jgi:hypothetical protein
MPGDEVDGSSGHQGAIPGAGIAALRFSSIETGLRDRAEGDAGEIARDRNGASTRTGDGGEHKQPLRLRNHLFLKGFCWPAACAPSGILMPKWRLALAAP